MMKNKHLSKAVASQKFYEFRTKLEAKCKELGIELLIEFPLTQDTACMTPEKFMEDILWKQLHAGLIVSGTDLSFGYRGEGNAAMLQSFAKKKEFSYQMIEGKRSSTIGESNPGRAG